MHRRRLLALAGAGLAGTAGCLSQPSSSDADPTDDPGGTNSPTDSQTVSPPRTTDSTQNEVVVADIVVRKAVRYESMMGSGGVLAAEETQYVVASVRGDIADSAPFVFETDLDSWELGLSDTVGATNFAVAGHEGGPFGQGLGTDGWSYLAFEVPSPLSASNPRITLDGPTDLAWELPAGARERLAAPGPRFELDSLTVPDELSQGDSMSVAMTVRNASDTDGRFLAAVYWPTDYIADDDESHLVEQQVAAGSEVTVSTTIDTDYTTSDAGPVTLGVEGHVTAERDVQVRDVSTPS